MEKPEISSYTKILDIRLKSTRRNVTIAGAVFFITLFAFFTLGMLELFNNQREIFLSGLLLVFFGMSFITAFVRYEILKNTIDLTHAFSRDEEEA
jgi:uncharacterized membrane protein